MLVVGEASGDVHGANLVEALHRQRFPAQDYSASPASSCRRTDFETLFNVSKLTGMGLVELAGNVKNIWRAYRLAAPARCEHAGPTC